MSFLDFILQEITRLKSFISRVSGHFLEVVKSYQSWVMSTIILELLSVNYDFG